MNYNDPTFTLLIIGLIISIYAQCRVSSTFDKWSNVRSKSGLTGARVARMILDQNGASSVRIERVPGKLTDHYDPKDGVLRLSDAVYNSVSVAALGVAAHEAGHAIQDAEIYMPLRVRQTLAPAVRIGSMAAMPLFVLGCFFSKSSLINIGILCFVLALLFYLVTLPIEYDASGRAVALLSGDFLPEEEIRGVKAVLSAAAFTYVAAALQAALELLNLVAMLVGDGND